MPEGPEIYFLSNIINSKSNSNDTNNYSSCSYGKQLFISNNGINEKWSFGLTGGIKINEDNIFTKTKNGNINGDITTYESIANEEKKLGLDFMTATEQEFNEEINKWKKSKSKLGGLLLTQTKIAGIGVAWGSEILNRCELRPDLKANEQDLTMLGRIIYFYQDHIKENYNRILDDCINTYRDGEFETNKREIINTWPQLFYSKREPLMSVYKKGKKVVVTNRTWWVRNDDSDI